MGVYDRQETLKLKSDISITIAGCGGVGYWVAKYAAMSGIEKIFLFDPDVIEEHNLNRLDLPLSVTGRNKAEITKIMINQIRPEALVISMPFILQSHTFTKTDWLVDCTDKSKSQETNQEIAKKFGSRYLKAGYNGEHITVADRVAEWGEAVDGYTIIPSWVVPASVVAAMAVAKIMKYDKMELSTDIKRMFRNE